MILTVQNVYNAPFEKWNLKVLPSYKYSDLDYTKHARFSDLGNEYKVSNFSFQAESSVLDFLEFYALCSYDFSDEISSGKENVAYSHPLFSAFFYAVFAPAEYFRPAFV